MEEFIKDQGVKRKMEILPTMSKIKTGLNLAEFPVIVGSQSGKAGLKFDAYKQF